VSILIQDPRSSTPGLGLLMWVKAAYGDAAPEVWAGLADNIVTVTPGWSEAYGLFLEGEADMVLSYTTSPAYHLIAEDDPTKAAAPFAEGHYLQVEVAGKLASFRPAGARAAFLAFMLTDAFQSAIPTTNWMYPAVTPEAGLPEGFETLITPATALLLPPDEAEALRDGRWTNGAPRSAASAGAGAAALLAAALRRRAARRRVPAGRGRLAALGPADWAAVRFTRDAGGGLGRR
jgi:thiamine transport system substrate-binding protein